jgi:hypothetical protein
VAFGDPRLKSADDDLAPLPRSWSSKTDMKGQIYFRYSPARATCWIDPRFLPEGWEQRATPKGDVYFARTSKKQTTWEDPRGLPPKWGVELDPTSQTLVFLQGQHQTPVDPRGLPPGWTQAIDGQRGRLYFSNHITKQTTWDDPRKGNVRTYDTRCCAESIPSLAASTRRLASWPPRAGLLFRGFRHTNFFLTLFSAA